MAANNAKVLFSYTEDERLVEFVSKFPCLFDLANPLYKNQLVKDNAWKEVAEFLKRSVEDCKKRWRNIKDTYMKRKKKEKGSTGSAVTKAKPWPLFEMLSFLETVDHKRLSISNIEEQESQDEEQTAATESNDIIEETSHSPQEFDDAPSTSEAPSTSKAPSTCEAPSFAAKRNTPNDSSRSQPTKKQKINNNYIQMMEERQKERTKIINSLNEKNEDEIDVFFKSIAMSVKKFTREIQNEAKLKSLQMVIDLETRNNKPTANTPQMSLSESNSRSSFFYSPSPPPPPITPVAPVSSNMPDFYVHAFNQYENL